MFPIEWIYPAPESVNGTHSEYVSVHAHFLAVPSSHSTGHHQLDQSSVPGQGIQHIVPMAFCWTMAPHDPSPNSELGTCHVPSTIAEVYAEQQVRDIWVKCSYKVKKTESIQHRSLFVRSMLGVLNPSWFLVNIFHTCWYLKKLHHVCYPTVLVVGLELENNIDLFPFI